MHPYFTFFHKTFPTYGVCIVGGILLANLLAFVMSRHKKSDMDTLLLFEAYGILGGFAGAKLLFLILSADYIRWDKLTDPTYLNQLMQGGFVFYGGLAGGILAILGAGRLHRLPTREYISDYLFMLPLIHGFGRIGCFFAGCCYGVPYDGVFAVTFPAGSYAPAGIPLFPVQLTEAGLLIGAALVLFFISRKHRLSAGLEIYCIFYACVRFVLEFLRFDSIRGHFGILSTSQWLSIGIAFLALVSLGYKKYKRSGSRAIKKDGINNPYAGER